MIRKYTVKYRLKHQWFFRTIKKVVGDAVPKIMPSVRVIFLEDDSTIEIPIEGTIFKFSRERREAQKDKMSKEAGQPIQTS